MFDNIKKNILLEHGRGMHVSLNIGLLNQNGHIYVNI